MFERVLVPMDTSDLAERILAGARRILTAEGTRVCVFHVLPTPTVFSHEPDPRGYFNALEKHLAREGMRAEVEMTIGDPAEEILRYADRWQPSLIAMSTHGRSGIGRWARGSVAERVLRRSRHPLLLANPRALAATIEGHGRPFRRILLPLDGSEASAAIVPVAAEIAMLCESEVIVIHAVTPAPTVSPAPQVDPHPTAEEVEGILEPYLALLEKAGIHTRLLVRYEKAAFAILAAAKEERVDLIAMATHGTSGVSRWVFGSVAEKVLREGNWPLLVRRTTGFVEAGGVEG